MDLLIKKLEHNVSNKMVEINLLKKNSSIVINSNNPLRFGQKLDYYDSLPLKMEKTDFSKIEVLWHEIDQKQKDI